MEKKTEVKEVGKVAVEEETELPNAAIQKRGEDRMNCKYKVGEIVYWYNMYTKRRRRMKIKKCLGKHKYELEYPDGKAFGKRTVYEDDLYKRRR